MGQNDLWQLCRGMQFGDSRNDYLVCDLNQFYFYVFDSNFHTGYRSSHTIRGFCSGSSCVRCHPSYLWWLRYPCGHLFSNGRSCCHVWVAGQIRRCDNRSRWWGDDVWSVAHWVSHCLVLSILVCFSSPECCHVHFGFPDLFWFALPWRHAAWLWFGSYRLLLVVWWR